MSDNIIFDAKLKSEAGKSSSRDVRAEGRIPSIVYGGKENIMLSIPQNQFQKEYSKGGFKTRLVELKLDGKVITAITRDVQTHPVSDLPVHADFQEVSKDTMIKIDINVKVINEDKSPGVKKGGVVNVVYRSIPMMCSPMAIPESIIIDVEGMEIGANKHINDIKLPESCTPVDKSNFTIVSIGGSADDDSAEEKQDEDEDK